jgi:HAMP domain-containing protein
VRNEAGLVLDTEGQPILPGAARPRCTSTQHDAVLSSLRGWQQTMQAVRDANEGRPPGLRDLGMLMVDTPELVLAADANGQVIARLGADWGDWYGSRARISMSHFAPVQQAELLASTGSPRLQAGAILWRDREADDPRLAFVGVAPVMIPGPTGAPTYAGTILVGTFARNDLASEMARPLSESYLVFFSSDRGTTRLAAENTLIPPGIAEQLRQATLRGRSAAGATEETASVTEALARQSPDPFHWEATLAGDPWLVSTVRVAGGEDHAIGFAVLHSVAHIQAPLLAFSRTLPAVALVLFLLGTILIVVITRSFLAPLEEISRGVQEVIAGNREYMWPVDDRSSFSDLSHSLNIMSARLQGKRDPDAEDGEGGEGWGAGTAPRPGGIAGLRRNRITDVGDNNGSTPPADP